MATDHLEATELARAGVDDLFDVVARHGLHFDQTRQTGVVFHMISCVTEVGRLGVTAIGDTPDQAWQLYQDAQDALLAEADTARAEGALIG